MTRLAGRVAIITGAASGIGLATTKLFAAEGARVATIDIVGADRAAEEARAAGAPDAFAHAADVSDLRSASEGIARIIERWRRIDILMTAAAIFVGKRLADTSAEEWDHTFAVNVRGTFLWVKESLPLMVTGGRGSIITLASEVALAGGRNAASYVASKGAILSLTRSVAVDYAAAGIRANTLVPGGIETPFLERSFAQTKDPAAAATASRARHAMGRFGLPEEVARAALFLACDESSFTTGSELRVDGGKLAV
jgi:NAD(P)-dependent dehydrogenase (short-subunit alcohol dehydrogenase family)